MRALSVIPATLARFGLKGGHGVLSEYIHLVERYRGTSMPGIRWVYLALAAIGAVLPMYYFVAWFEEHGYDLAAMVDAWNVNDASTGLVWDLTVSFAALVVWVTWETVQSRRWLNLIAVPAGLCVGVSFAFPLYLWLRSRD